jgi:class 3 adenylate cyclase/tetratricopeptide (TPR) repeat protein
MPYPDRTERQPKKLEMAHVLFMDIVGYSKLPMDHQEAALHTLQAVVSANPECQRAQASQEIIKLPTGDGMALVFFNDAEAAARCAREVSRALKPHPEILLRMGLHSGPVYRVADINANQNVAGGGINIAQRVMDCGDAGHILASQSVADVLGHLSNWEDCLHDLGETEVKHGVRVHLYNLYTEEVGNAELPQKLHTARKTAATVHSKAKKKKLALSVVAAGVVAAVAVGGFLYPHHAHALTDKDTIVLADLTNTTGDPVFDGTLRQGLSVQLEQSPFLSVISDQQVRQTLAMMGQPAGATLTPAIARELCQRTGSAAVLDGSITQIGSQYSLIVRAVNCSDGKSLASTEVRANDKNHVLDALGTTASELRSKLGESLSMLQKFDTPLAEATTSSLEALQAMTLGFKISNDKDESAAAIPFFQHAIKLDPNFASAYLYLGVNYGNLGEYSLASENIQKAFALRERVSERERLTIESNYHVSVTGNLEKARQSYELWSQTYSRDALPHNGLGYLYSTLGDYDQALSQFREALLRGPDSGQAYGNLVYTYLALSRLEDAQSIAEEAKAKNLDAPDVHGGLYFIGLQQGDAVKMSQQVKWSSSKLGVEDWFLGYEADTAAYFGRLGKAREFTNHAVASAERVDEKEGAASYEMSAALREALFGNLDEARKRVASVFRLSKGRDVQYGAALALALTGDAVRAKALADELGKDFPEDTIVQFNYLPALNAQLSVLRHDTVKAIELLQAAAPYELGQPLVGDAPLNLYPVFVRGDAHLAAHQGSEAAAEFQKILDHRGVMLNSPIGALAHLQIARAYAMQGDTAKSKAAYQDFLALWKDADPNIPILIAAKSEYAKIP